jgi:hypothetical protein
MLLSESDMNPAYFLVADISRSIDRSFLRLAKKAILMAPNTSFLKPNSGAAAHIIPLVI